MIASCFPTSSSCWANLQSHSFILGESGGESLWTWSLCSTVDERCSELTRECLIFNPGNDCSFIHNDINNHFKRVYVIGSSAGMTRRRTEYLTADRGYSGEKRHRSFWSQLFKSLCSQSMRVNIVTARKIIWTLSTMFFSFLWALMPLRCVICLSVCFAERFEWWLSVSAVPGFSLRLTLHTAPWYCVWWLAFCLVTLSGGAVINTFVCSNLCFVAFVLW